MAIPVNNRRFSPANPVLTALTRQHLDALVAICASWHEGPLGLAQGYTYLGQFLAHELVSRNGLPPRSTKLILDSLYPDFADAIQVDSATGYFRYQPADPAQHLLADIVRESRSPKPRIQEVRNDDQLLLSQLHLLLQLFHNKVVDRVAAAAPATSAQQRYAIARQYVRACLQRIYVEEYLAVITVPLVYQSLMLAGVQILGEEPGAVDLPYEMTHAAARFGHSMVRESYRLNRQHQAAADVSLAALFGYSGSNANFKGIPDELAIDWSLFFPGVNADLNELAQRINPGVVSGMRAHPNPDLIRTNLEVGAGKDLASGQQVATLVLAELRKQGMGSLGITPVLTGSVGNETRVAELDKLGFWEQTPLWLFVLLEADGNAPYYRGRKLGPLGSLLLIEIVKQAIDIPGMPHYTSVQRQYDQLYKLPAVGSMADLINF